MIKPVEEFREPSIDETVASSLRIEIRRSEELIYEIYKGKATEEAERAEDLVKMVANASYAVIAVREQGYDDKEVLFELGEMLRHVKDQANLGRIPNEVRDLLSSIGLLGLMQEEMSHHLALKTVRERGLGV